jgi:hypothetical protein
MHFSLEYLLELIRVMENMRAGDSGRGDLVFFGFAVQRDASHRPICPTGVDNKV